MAVLNVNIDHVATVRQARLTDERDPVWAAVQCELAGANGITVHLRQDRRHICDRDVRLLKETVACKLNLEMCMAEPIGMIAEEVKPDQVTLVPEKRAELTTEGGLDCARHKRRLAQVVKRMHKKGILVSTFIAPEPEQIAASAETGCDAIELTTAPENPRAFALYQKCGFQYLGDVENQMGEGKVRIERCMFLPLKKGAKPMEEPHAPPVG